MSIRTTITLDEDVAERVRLESRSQGKPFRQTLNDLLRAALLDLQQNTYRRTVEIKPVHMGYCPGLNHDSVEALVEFGEGEDHR